jgi:hypothetical protein
MGKNKKWIIVLSNLIVISAALNIFQFIIRSHDTAALLDSLPVDSLLSRCHRIPFDSLGYFTGLRLLDYVSIDSEGVAHYPAYDLKKEPPLPVSSAILLSRKALETFVQPDSPAWQLSKITLQKGLFLNNRLVDREKWMYVASYNRVIEPQIGPGYNEIKSVPVLFSGATMNKPLE